MPEQNGVAERLNRTLITKARSMLAAAELPKELWGEAVYIACYLRNLTPQNKESKAPSQPCEVETSLLPPLVRLARSRHLYALRCLQLQQQHTINIRINAIKASNKSSKP